MTGRQASPDSHYSPPGQARGRVRVPGSKSITHRSFILAAQATAPTTVRGALLGADTGATLRCLMDLGADVRIQDRAAGIVAFHPAPLHAPAGPLDCMNAGTALRLLAGLVARLPAATILIGDESLSSRPSEPLLEALRHAGAAVDAAPGGRPPLRIQGPIRPGSYVLPGASSSQYGSSLLLTLPFLLGDSELALEAPVHSAPYLDVTVQAATAFGIQISSRPSPGGGRHYDIPGGQAARPPASGVVEIEGDWSTAAFPLVAGAITGGKIEVAGATRASGQGDKAILAHLQQFGSAIQWDDDGTAVTLSPRHHDSDATLVSPGTIDVAATPDAFPALCVLAAVANGTTTFSGGGQLRVKESDRIVAMAQGLKMCGVNCEERPDGLVVHGVGGPVPGTGIDGPVVQAHHDHRIHMAFAILGLASQRGVSVDGAASVAVSYPNFHEDLRRLTGQEQPT